MQETVPCTNNSYSPFMIKCPVCHFRNDSLEGANTKLFSLFHTQKTNVDKRHCRLFYHQVFYDAFLSKITADNVQITFQTQLTCFVPPSSATLSFGQIVRAERL